MKERTLIFLHKPDSQEILLAMKKKGFGKGKWNGVGGKLEEGESIEEAAVREAIEEIGVNIDINKLEKRAEIDFIFKDKSDFDQYVYVFFVEEWEGEPTESEEMKPEWFHYDSVPYKKMWVDDEHWLPITIQGKTISARFVFDKSGNELLEMNIEEQRF